LGIQLRALPRGLRQERRIAEVATDPATHAGMVYREPECVRWTRLLGPLTEYNGRRPDHSGCPTHYCREVVMPEANLELQNEVAGLIVSALNLDISPQEIQADAPLYGEGLGLDSIDILEVALVVSKHFGFQLRADNADNVSIFSSLASLARHIAAHRTK